MKNSVYKFLTIFSMIIAITALLFSVALLKKAKAYETKYEQAEANNEVLKRNQKTLEEAISKYGNGNLTVVKKNKIN